MTDIVEVLRSERVTAKQLHEAREEIERLRAEVQRAQAEKATLIEWLIKPDAEASPEINRIAAIIGKMIQQDVHLAKEKNGG